jgi:uncharacterized protein (DUF58 family)
MRRSWVSWGLWLLAVFALNLFTQAGAALFLLAASVVIPSVCMVLNRLRTPRLSVALTFPDLAEKGETIEGRFSVRNPEMFPYSRAVAMLFCDNELTAEQIEKELTFQVGLRQKTKYTLSYACDYCGRVNFRVTGFRLYDIFGLTFRISRMDCRGSVVVYPDLFAPEILVRAASGFGGEDVRYSESKRGFDLAEPFGVRDYQAGDSAKSIHWKLTQKFDRLLVKEPGLPVSDSIVLLFETGYLPGGVPAPAITDAMAQAFLSLSRTLIASNVPHTVGWQNQKSGLFESYEIGTEEDSVWILSKLLSARPKEDALSCPEHFAAAFGGAAFSHAVYVSSYVKDDLTQTALSLTTLLCVDDGGVPGGASNDENGGAFDSAPDAILFTPENIARDLGAVSI